VNGVHLSWNAHGVLFLLFCSFQSSDPTTGLTKQLGALFRTMDSTSQAVSPDFFTSVFRSVYPQFAETNSQGHMMQQDAEEALSQLMQTMANHLKTTPPTATDKKCINTYPANNVIDQYFAGEMETRLKPEGGDEKEERVGKEVFKKLRCFIDNQTNFLFQGITKVSKQEVTHAR